MAQPPHTRAAMRALYPVCQVAELTAGYRDTTQQLLELAYRSDLSMLRGSVNSFLEAEDMPVDFFPRDVLPGHHQGVALCFGTSPHTHRFTFRDTGPTSAYPEHYPWPWLLRASFSPMASGWHLLHEVTDLI